MTTPTPATPPTPAGDNAALPIRIITRPRKHVWFETVTPNGNTIRIKGDPKMSEETRLALCEAMDLLAKKHAEDTKGQP